MKIEIGPNLGILLSMLGSMFTLAFVCWLVIK